MGVKVRLSRKALYAVAHDGEAFSGGFEIVRDGESGPKKPKPISERKRRGSVEKQPTSHPTTSLSLLVFLVLSPIPLPRTRPIDPTSNSSRLLGKMKFSTLFVGAFAALAAAQGSEISSAASSAVSSVASSATGGSSSSRASSSGSSSGSSSASAANSASSSSASQTSGSSSASGSGSVTSSASIHTTTIFYQYPNTFHKPVSPTLLGSTVITSTDGQTSSYSLPKGASTFDVTVRNVTTTFVYTNTFHGPVSKTWLTTESYVTTGKSI